MSIIPTDASTATRNGDALRLGLGSWCNRAEGTIVIRASALSSFPCFLATLSDGSFNNYIGATANTAIATAQVQAAGVAQAVQSQNRGSRFGQPIVVAWSISVEGTAVEFPAITERQRDGKILRDPQASALGPGRNDLCVSIPRELDKVTGLTIRGQINYRMPHGLWTIWQELPVVRVPPFP